MHDALHVVGAEHRIGKGIRETFRNTTNSVVSLWEGVEMLEFLLEKLERSVPKWIRNRLEEAKDVLECFAAAMGIMSAICVWIQNSFPFCVQPAGKSQNYFGRCYGIGKKVCLPS